MRDNGHCKSLKLPVYMLTDPLLAPGPKYEKWAKHELNELTGTAKMSERSRNVIDNRALLFMEFGRSLNVNQN